MRPRVNTKKHIVQQGINAITAGTIKNLLLARAVAAPSGSTQVTEGSIITAIFIEMWYLATSSQPGSVTVTLEKRIGSMAAMSFTNSATLDAYTNKKNILYTTQGITPDSNGNPIPLLRQWLKIPKGKQRFGLEDSLILNISANVEGLTECGVAIYKEQF